MGRFRHALASAFEGDPVLPVGNCPKFRPAVLGKASCPGVGPEIEQRRRSGGGGEDSCPAQPPACCEAARRAEAAARMVADKISGNVFLQWMQRSEVPVELAALLPPPTNSDCDEALAKRRQGNQSLMDFL
mmetsp:Transcript_76665/g.135271  ORF Transcript_76665/g.135271 Transcript_76665/m.135271 type:complete len:131 (+) Transcript_76665:94-486(+)